MLARRSLLLGALSALAQAGCARREGDEREERGQLVVFAAASLREAFTSLRAGFTAKHPGVELAFSFAGSQQLRAQIEHGAEVDVFASADVRHLEELAAAELVGRPTVFAHNEPVVVVAPDAAGLVRSFDELPRAERIVVGAAEVPIGRYTTQILERAARARGDELRARIEAKVVSRELDVRQALSKVMLGEAQAGVVYRTDARAAGERVRVVPIPPELNVVAVYPIAVVAASARPKLAAAWIEHVLSPEGQRLLGEAGFSAPGTGTEP